MSTSRVAAVGGCGAAVERGGTPATGGRPGAAGRGVAERAGAPDADLVVDANEAWGGQRNVHNLLSDANVDWGQQLLQVKQWQDNHPNEECWFAYFAAPFLLPSDYGIPCKRLPTVTC